MLRVILNTIFCAVLFVGCEKEVNDERLRVTPSNIEIGCEGGTVQVDIESTSGWEIIVPSDCTWVTSDRYESEVGHRQWIALSILRNKTESTRKATITISNRGQSQDITITQSALSFSVTPESIDAGQEKTTKDISINSNISWSAKSSDSWITLSKSTGYAGTTILTINIDANTLASSRSGYVEISNSEYNISRRINIQQNGYTPPEDCIVYTSTSQITIDSSAYFGALIESHTWNNGNGVIRFDGPVTSIGEYAFYECRTLLSINIPNSVTSIGNLAFWGCDSLTSITIPNSVTSIGEYAFSGCGILTSITIPNSVNSIGDWAFACCSSLTSITIPDSVTWIGDCAFESCSSLQSFKGKYASSDGRCLIIDGKLIAFAPAGLTSYTIPDSVTSIGNWAFSGCSSFTSITIPDSVTTIGEFAFSNCSSLTSITIPNSVTSIEYCAFAWCSSLTSITIGNGVTSIGESAFNGCSSLTSITIPNSVTSIGEHAFSECSSLISINIPNSVTSIGYSAFIGCRSLTSITIPESVTSIGYSAFWGCSSLTSITIPESVTSIEEAAFACCSSLKSVKGEYASSDGRCLIIDGKLIAFAPAELTSYTIPESVTSIGAYAFCDCSSLTSINIPESVTNIRFGAFCDCSSLKSITIPQSVTSIESWTFEGCSSLKSVYCKATTPPALESGGLGQNRSGRKIYVPRNSVNAYISAEGWSDYASNIVGYDF